ncbi:response regulator transcription factor [Mucilaginibacter sp. SG564]|uniref:response regulator transcription factor n=1 Tax=Mucilaginibacter sp. SG564 TaxID=2587022 RepID=UPI0020A69A6E|nr:response regulator [Mucilaginibacter sp. SG564]NOW94295.1 DNA-binding response OmpR family regulator [Mucilaginibacter sp. SG564]
MLKLIYLSKWQNWEQPLLYRWKNVMSKRILVIDDDEDILEILHIVFQEEGYEVVLSNTGDAAEHIQIIHPDLILLDVRIEGSKKRGDEICAELKEQYKEEKMPIILVSAESDLELLANECGADHYISKPFDIYQLLMHVQKILV